MSVAVLIFTIFRNSFDGLSTCHIARLKSGLYVNRN